MNRVFKEDLLNCGIIDKVYADQKTSLLYFVTGDSSPGRILVANYYPDGTKIRSDMPLEKDISSCWDDTRAPNDLTLRVWRLEKSK